MNRIHVWDESCLSGTNHSLQHDRDTGSPAQALTLAYPRPDLGAHIMTLTSRAGSSHHVATLDDCVRPDAIRFGPDASLPIQLASVLISLVGPIPGVALGDR